MTRLPPFTLHRPRTVQEAGEMLAAHGEEAVFYTGGTELFLLFKLGFAEYAHVIDLKGISELRGIERGGGGLRIGAAETHRAIERDPLVREGWPALAAMERSVGNLRVRTVGSIGGNLCFADPHSDPTTFLLAAGATVQARRGAQESREIAIGDFAVSAFENALQPGELLAGVQVPQPAAGAAIVHRKVVFHERPALSIACHLRADGGRLADVRLAVGSVGNTAGRASAAEEMLSGLAADGLDGDALAQAGELAAQSTQPVQDSNGSIEYKRHLVAVMAERVVAEAVATAGRRVHGEAR